MRGMRECSANVTQPQIKKFKGHLLMAFFFGNIKIIRCQKDTVGNHLKTQVLIKNLNLPLKKKED